ncbi:MAG: ATP-binding protein [Chitinophagaceae bacterium]
MKTRFKTNFLIYVIIICVLAFLVASIILQLSTEKSIRELDEGNKQSITLFNVHSQIEKVTVDVITIESKIRGLVITGNDKFVEGVRDTMINLKVDLEVLQQIAMTNVNQAQFLTLTILADKKISSCNQILDAYYKQGKEGAAQIIASGRPTRLRDSIMQITSQIEGQLQHHLTDNIAKNQHRSQSVLALSRSLTILSVIATLLLSLIVIRHLVYQHRLINRLETLNDSEAEARKQVEKVSADIHDLYNHAPCGYHSLDKEGTFISINDTELNWLGYKREEMLHKIKFPDLLDERGLELFKQKFPEFKKNGSVSNLHFNIITKKGTLLPVSLSSTAIYDEAGNYVSSRTTLYDITDLLKNEQALKEARRIAEDSVRVKEQFLANMSHEIRTPINSVIGFTNLLQKTSLSDDQSQFVTLIQSASENLLTIINDILDISKIEAGMLRVEKNPFSLRGLCSSIETMFYHKAREKKLSFSISVQDDIPDTLQGDAVRLTQILVNLISNAIKFTHHGGITVNITSAQQNTTHVRLRIAIKDSGIGIPKDKVVTIFERFEQGETDTTRKYGGTGLGLSIVKNLVQLQGGTITVQSEYEKGTEFLLELQYELLPMNEAAHTDAQAGDPDNNISSFNGVKILVAEDNQMNQLLVKYIFRNWQLHFELAENGKEVIDWLQREQFDLLLLDIQMPIMDGYVTAQTIRNELHADIPIIAMTAHALAGEREKCLSYGMNDYISKPLHENELFKLLKKYLATHREPISALKDKFHFINLDFLSDLVMGNEDFLKNIVRQFLNQFPGEMDVLQNAVEQNNAKLVSTQAHHIQSTVSVLCKGSSFIEQLDKLEQLAKRKPKHEVLKETFGVLNNYKKSLLEETERLLNTNIM